MVHGKIGTPVNPGEANSRLPRPSVGVLMSPEIAAIVICLENTRLGSAFLNYLGCGNSIRCQSFTPARYKGSVKSYVKKHYLKFTQTDSVNYDFHYKNRHLVS
ncbi:hypothetical protein GWI33_008269 [Rhynchophorus ferrugineus]|uniref:Uncharacterized protein n=1 Tax=Rhynchophorus ferrugineus TaxID=354439 RepID=A0A834IVP3_RHYFE|nr:hypothetical protein GWI33_008269 [Rhynchophorus ferrugineus]